MFKDLEALPPDPILGLSAAYREDTNPNKVDLGVGVYKDEAGNTPVMRAIKAAEKRLLEAEDSKSYIAQMGVPEFNAGVLKLILGDDHAALRDDRARTLMTPGGCGALRVGAEFIKSCAPEAKVWVSDPTWANHIPLLGSAGLKLETYPYYNRTDSALDFEAMMAALQGVGAGDVVLLHGCCHNPCGADLSREQWREVADLADKNGFLPFIDLAYQGFGQGVDEDAYGVRLFSERLPEVMIASSCSKNFGLYRERTGSLTVVTETAEKAVASQSHTASVARGIYSMPPAHGGFLAGTVLQDEALRKVWLEELSEMCDRINSLRSQLVAKLAEYGAPRDFAFIERESGMFSFLGISPEQVAKLKEEFSIYMTGNSRINVAGISTGNIDYVAQSITAVLKG